MGAFQRRFCLVYTSCRCVFFHLASLQQSLVRFALMLRWFCECSDCISNLRFEMPLLSTLALSMLMFSTLGQHPPTYPGLGGGTRPTPPGHASVVHTFEAVVGSWRSVSAPAVSRVMGGTPERNKNSNFFYR